MKDMNWKSLYIYCHSLDAQELLMLALESTLNKMTDKWFFIKYWRGGPHLRLRYLDSRIEIKDEIENVVTSFFEENKVHNIGRDEYYKNISFDGEEEDEEVLPWFESGTWFYEDYIPETERYGDGKLLEISENIFYYSSQLALEIFKNVRGINKRMVISSYIMYHLLKYNGGLQVSFLDSYRAYWKRMVINEPKVNRQVMYDMFNKIESGQIRFAFIDKVLESIYGEFDDLRCLTSESETLYILSSQIHMMNNRISVTPEFEYLISKEMWRWINDKMENNK